MFKLIDKNVICNVLYCDLEKMSVIYI